MLDEVQGFFGNDVVEGHEGVVRVEHKVLGNSADMGFFYRYAAIVFAGNEQRQKRDAAVAGDHATGEVDVWERGRKAVGSRSKVMSSFAPDRIKARKICKLVDELRAFVRWRKQDRASEVGWHTGLAVFAKNNAAHGMSDKMHFGRRDYHRIESREEVRCDRGYALGRFVGADDGIVTGFVKVLFKTHHAESTALQSVDENNGFFVRVGMTLHCRRLATLL